MSDTHIPSTAARSTGASGPAASSGLSTEGTNAKEMVNRVTDSAHGAVDRAAEKAAPVLQKLEAGVAQASGAVQDQAHRMRELGDQWTHTLRNTVRENPLTSVVLAFAAGALTARITRDR